MELLVAVQTLWLSRKKGLRVNVMWQSAQEIFQRDVAVNKGQGFSNLKNKVFKSGENSLCLSFYVIILLFIITYQCLHCFVGKEQDPGVNKLPKMKCQKGQQKRSKRQAGKSQFNNLNFLMTLRTKHAIFPLLLSNFKTNRWFILGGGVKPSWALNWYTSSLETGECTKCEMLQRVLHWHSNSSDMYWLHIPSDRKTMYSQDDTKDRQNRIRPGS